MKLRAIAANTFSGLVRNKIIILFCAGCICVLLLHALGVADHPKDAWRP